MGVKMLLLKPKLSIHGLCTWLLKTVADIGQSAVIKCKGIQGIQTQSERGYKVDHIDNERMWYASTFTLMVIIIIVLCNYLKSR